MNRERLFRFKQFEVHHSRSAMKVGVDGVLLGAWADVSGSNIVDVGCGCGLIAIMAAQRNPEAKILGIDIDPDTIDEAKANAKASPWAERLSIRKLPYEELDDANLLFDCIISNPPFFDAGMQHPTTNREISRHTATLSPEAILLSAHQFLKNEGTVSMITPTSSLEGMLTVAQKSSLYLSRICEVVTVEGKTPKRILTQWRKVAAAPDSGKTVHEMLVIEEGEHGHRYFSKAYIDLCRPFYLHM